MLRWHLQEGRSAIPKSTKPARIAENFDVFDFELSATRSPRSTRSTPGCAAGRSPTASPSRRTAGRFPRRNSERGNSRKKGMVKVDTLQGASCSRIFNDATLDSAAKELETPLASTPPSIWILPHGAPHGAIHELRRTVHCRLRPAPGAARRVSEITERRAIRRSREARASAHHDCQPEPAATTFHRRC